MKSFSRLCFIFIINYQNRVVVSKVYIKLVLNLAMNSQYLFKLLTEFMLRVFGADDLVAATLHTRIDGSCGASLSKSRKCTLDYHVLLEPKIHGYTIYKSHGPSLK